MKIIGALLVCLFIGCGTESEQNNSCMVPVATSICSGTHTTLCYSDNGASMVTDGCTVSICADGSRDGNCSDASEYACVASCNNQ